MREKVNKEKKQTFMGLGYLGKEKKRKLHIFTVMAIPIDIKAIKSKFKCFPIELKKTKT